MGLGFDSLYGGNDAYSQNHMCYGAFPRNSDVAGASGMRRGRPDGDAGSTACSYEHPDGSTDANRNVGPWRSYADTCASDTNAGSDTDAFV